MSKKIMIIDGGPRKNFNTAAMIEAFANGVKAASKREQSDRGNITAAPIIKTYSGKRPENDK